MVPARNPQYSNYCFSISNASFFYCCLQDFVFFSSLIVMCPNVDFFAFISGFWTSSICKFKSFAESEEFSAIISSDIFFCTALFLSHRDSDDMGVSLCGPAPQVPEASSTLLQSTFCGSSWINPTDSSSSSLILLSYPFCYWVHLVSTLSWQFYFSVLNFPFASSLATSLLRLPFFPFASKVFVLIYWIIFIMPVLKALIIPTFVSSRYHCLLNVISLQVEVFLVLCLLIKYTLYHGHSEYHFIRFSFKYHIIRIFFFLFYF